MDRFRIYYPVILMVVLLAAMAFAAFGGERPRVRFEGQSRPAVTKPAALPAIPPAPKLVESRPAQASVAKAQPAAQKSPVLYVYTAKRDCSPCRRWDTWYEKHQAEFPCPVQVIEFRTRREVPADMRVPHFVLVDQAGTEHAWTGFENSGVQMLQQIRSALQAVKVPAAIGPEVPGASPGLPAADQLRKFLGASGGITVTPDSPIRAVMEDGSSISYKSLQARYTIGDQPTVTFSPPLPQLEARKFWLRFGALLQDVKQDAPMSISFGTTRGRYRLSLEEVK